MALDNFQRVTGATEFDSGTTAAGALQTGEVTVVNGGSGFIVGDLVELTGGSGAGGVLAVATVNSTTGAILTVTVDTAGAGYGDAEAIIEPAGSEVGVSNSADYFDHANYELGGVVEEYKEGTGAVVTTTTGDITAIVSGGVDYRVGDVIAVGGATATVDSVDGVTGEALTFTAVDTDTSVADGDHNTVFISRTLKTDATGEYAGINAENDPTVSVVRKGDGQQWMVQKRYIDGGTIEVFAEPTTVNSVGQIVGNTIRAEDITDEYRCVSVFLSDGVSPRFEWVTSSTGDADSKSYGFCREIAGGDVVGALVDADCPAGWEWDGATGCQTRLFSDVNTDEGADTINAKVAMEQCFAGGNWYEPSAPKGSRCIEAVADNFSLANFSFTTNSSAQDYAATVCKQMGFDWEPAPSYTCVDPVDVTTLVTQATCTAAGHVWVAGTCYNRADFGDGYSRQGNAGDTKNKLPK